MCAVGSGGLTIWLLIGLNREEQLVDIFEIRAFAKAAEGPY
jgi:hypothetical protein